MKENLSYRVQFRTLEHVNRELISRMNATSGYNDQARLAVERHFWLCQEAYYDLVSSNLFTTLEYFLIFDACQNFKFGTVDIPLLAVHVEREAKLRNLTNKWRYVELQRLTPDHFADLEHEPKEVSVDLVDLFRKLQSLSHLQKTALVDAAAKFMTDDIECRKEQIRLLSVDHNFPTSLIITMLVTFGCYEENNLEWLQQGKECPEWLKQEPNS